MKYSIVFAVAVFLGAGTSAAERTAASPTVESLVLQRAHAAVTGDLRVVGVVVPGYLAKVKHPRALSVRWRTAPRVGNMTVQVVVDTRRGERRGWVRLTIRARAKIAVARHDLPQGHVVARDDLEVVHRAVDGVPPPPPLALIGAKVTKAVAKQAVIRASDVQMPAPVARGTDVAVVVRRGRLEIRTRGVLQTASLPGRVVRIRLASSGKVAAARLVDRTTAVLVRVGGKR